MSGRKLDPIWRHFEAYDSQDVKSKRAKCKHCREAMVALVARMKKHISKCKSMSKSANLLQIEVPEAEPRPGFSGSSSTSLLLTETDDETSVTEPFSDRSSGNLDSFVIKTTISEKKKLGIQVAKFIYATNSSFRTVEHPEFIKLINDLHAGYKPPNRHNIANELLEEVYNSVCLIRQQNLKNKTVCMSMDGWSNIHNEPLICIAIVSDGKANLINTINTGDRSHTGDYLLQLAIDEIKSCQKLNCDVGSFVTDNASNMSKMRHELSKVEEIGMPDIITYGCSAHILNLLAKDLDNIPVLKEDIKTIMKYFRNHHFPAAKYKEAGGSSLVLPQDVRWNTLADCLESYLKNWHILCKVCSENRVSIDTEIVGKIHDHTFKINCENYLFKFKRIAVALDRVQKENCTISEAVEIWIELERELETHCNLEEVRQIETRMKMALSAPHYLANLLDHRYNGQKLRDWQIEEAMQYVHQYHPEAMASVINYQAKSFPFGEYLFSMKSKSNVQPVAWWGALKNRINNETLSLTTQLHTAIASSAGIERIFSTFGMVHSKLRNKLGVEKAAKLVNIFKCLNQ